MTIDTEAIQGHLELPQSDPTQPLLAVKAPKGILGCGYINVETCNRAGEVCAIVTGVNTFDDVHKAKVVAAPNRAVELGIQVGESGQDTLSKMR